MDKKFVEKMNFISVWRETKAVSFLRQISFLLLAHNLLIGKYNEII